MTGPTRAIVTVAYRSDAELPAFLESARMASAEPTLIVVVDNLPGEGNARSIAREHDARYVPLEVNGGYGAAINAGVRLIDAEVEWVLVSNPDVLLTVGALDELVDYAAAHPGVASVGPRILNDDGSTYPSARAIPSVRFGIGHAFLGRVWAENPWTKSYHVHGRVEERQAGWLSGSCVLVRRSAFDAVNGFDEGYFMYFEDVDLGYRFGRHGWSNVYLPSVSVTHLGARSTESESGAMVVAHHRSAERFLTARYASPWLAPLRWMLLVGLRTRRVLRRH